MPRLRIALLVGLLSLTACTTSVPGMPSQPPPAGGTFTTVLDSYDLITGFAPDVVGGRDVAALPGGGFVALFALLNSGASGGGSLLVTLAEDDGDLRPTDSWLLPWLRSPAHVHPTADGGVVVAGARSEDAGGGFGVATLAPGADAPQEVRLERAVPLPASGGFHTALSADGRTLFAALPPADDDASRLLAIGLDAGTVLERGPQVETAPRAFVGGLTARPDGGVTAVLSRAEPRTDQLRPAVLLTYDAGLRPTTPPVELTPGRPSIPTDVALTGDGTPVVLVIDDPGATYTPRLITVHDDVVSGVDVAGDGADEPADLVVDGSGEVAHAGTPSSVDPAAVLTFDVASGATLSEVSPCPAASRFDELAVSTRTGHMLALGLCDYHPTAVLLGR
ncbi:MULTISPECIES: hypothetical protein [unclassified Blastococcus]